MNNETIFVSIAAYRDPELEATVKDIFAKAKNPDRVHLGICWQHHVEDEKPFTDKEHEDNIRVINISHKKSLGACWARSLIQQLYDGEDYTLQIDSHMRFSQDWDVRAIELLEAADSEKPIISFYPTGYSPPNKLDTDGPFRPVPKAPNEWNEGVPLYGSVSYNLDDYEGDLGKGGLYSGCFAFARGELIEEVPYDPNLYFFGEEISMTVRCWTHGYDFFFPKENIAYHQWNREERKHTHFSDHDDFREKYDDKSKARARHMLGMKTSDDPKVLKDLDRYGLGTVSSLTDFEEAYGIKFSERHVTKEGLNGQVKKRPEGREEVMPPAPLGLSEPMKSKILSAEGPIKVFESEQIVVYDNFLPEDDFEKIHEYMLREKYVHINTSGSIGRVWKIRDGFPLRGEFNLFHYADKFDKPIDPGTYPTDKSLDIFSKKLKDLSSNHPDHLGKEHDDWKCFSVSPWLYPKGTGLSLHDDDGNTYSGAYTYFTTKQWNIHWGGLLMVLDRKTDTFLRDHKFTRGPLRNWEERWLYEDLESEICFKSGFAQCVFPKPNRIVLIKNDAFHLVTTVNEAAGDRVRMSLAGFFQKNDQK